MKAVDAAPGAAAARPHGGTLKLAGLLAFFMATYWLQGVAGVWFGSLQPGYIRSFGLSYNGSGIISTMRMLPWWAKLLIAMPQDRYSLCGLGHRLPYAFLGIALGAVCIASLGQVSPAAQWDLYLFIVMLSSYGIANADAAADGMAVDHAAEEHGAIVQGVMSAGLTLGAMIGGAVAGRLVGEYGRGAAVWWLTAACAIALPTVFLTREERPPEREANSFRAVFAALWGSMKQARFVALASFIVLGQLGNSIASQPLDLWVLAKFDISDEQFAYMNVVANVAGLLGAVLVAVIFDRVDKKAVLVVESVLYVALNYLPLALRDKDGVQAYWFWNAFAGQVHFVATSRLMVLYAEKTAGASFFAMTASISNFSMMLGTAVGGAIAEKYGPEVNYYAGSTLNVFMLVPIFFLTDTQPLVGRWARKSPAGGAGAGGKAGGFATSADMDRTAAVDETGRRGGSSSGGGEGVDDDAIRSSGSRRYLLPPGTPVAGAAAPGGGSALASPLATLSPVFTPSFTASLAPGGGSGTPVPPPMELGGSGVGSSNGARARGGGGGMAVVANPLAAAHLARAAPPQLGGTTAALASGADAGGQYAQYNSAAAGGGEAALPPPPPPVPVALHHQLPPQDDGRALRVQALAKPHAS